MLTIALNFHNLPFVYFSSIDWIQKRYHAITSMVHSKFKLHFEKADQKEFGFHIESMYSSKYVHRNDDEK